MLKATEIRWASKQVHARISSSFSAHDDHRSLSLDRDIPFSFSLLASSVRLYSPEATISNVFTHNVCLPNIVDERMDGRDHLVPTGGVSECERGCNAGS